MVAADTDGGTRQQLKGSQQDEELMASIEGSDVERAAQQGELDEDEQLMDSIIDEVPTAEALFEDTDLLVAAERAVALPLPPMLRFGEDLEPKQLNRALEQPSPVTSQHIGVGHPGRCVKFLGDTLDITAEEHVRRHRAYTRARVVGLARWAAIREARLGSLLVLPGLWCMMGVLTATVVHSGGSVEVVQTVWAAAGLVTLLLLCLRAWRAKAVAAAAQPVSTGIRARRRQDPQLAFGALWCLTWAYAMLLFLVPATAMVQLDGYSPQAGAYLFLFALWFAGWGHHGISRAAVPKVEHIAMMSTMPDGLTFRLRVLAVIYEGYVACGFAFFPALPWKRTSVPKPVINFFEAASFEFGVNAHSISFLVACAAVPAAFAALAAVKRMGGAEQLLMVVDLFFESMMFPVCKQLIGVLTCTGGNLRETTTETVEGNTTTFTTKRVCGRSVPFDRSCMDSRPDLECWGEEHFWYVLAVFLFLVPYYVGGVKLRTETQKQTSTVVIDGLFSILTFQIKFLLAVITSGFGSCHAWLVVASVEISVIVMLIVTAWRSFSNVLQLTALRVGGLAAASLNGFVAAYVAWIVAPDSCTEFDDEVYKLHNLLPDEYGTHRVMVVVTEVRDSTGSLVASTTVPAGALPVHESDARDTSSQDYVTFIALVFANAFVLLVALVWYYRASARLIAQWQTMGDEDRIRLNKRVDYPIVRKRLSRLPSRAKTRMRSQMTSAAGLGSGRSILKLARVVSEENASQSDEVRNGFMMCASEELAETRSTARAAGKQLEDLTIQLLLFKNTQKTLFLKRDPRVFFFDLDVRTVGCERLMRHLKTVLENALARDSGRLNKVTCGHCGRKQLVAQRTVAVQFAPKPLGLANSRRWAENIEERLCFLGQVPQLTLIDLRGTDYGLELLALGACDPVGRSKLSPATLAYVVAGTSVLTDGSPTNHLPNDASGKAMGYDVIPETVVTLPSSLDALVLDFMNPSAQNPAVVGTRDRADQRGRSFAQIYSEFCDLFAEGCLQWKVGVISKLSVFAKLSRWIQDARAADLSEWIAQIMDVDKAMIVDAKFVQEDRSTTSLKQVHWSLFFRVRQRKKVNGGVSKPPLAPLWNKKASFDSAVVLSNFIKGFLQSRAIREDHMTESVTRIARAWRKRRNRKRSTRSRRRSLSLAVQATSAASAQKSPTLKPAMGKNNEEDAVIEKELYLHVHSRKFSRTDKFKALRQMVARRVPGSKIRSQQFDAFQKRAGEVIDLSFTSIDVRKKDLGPWHVALIAAWVSHHPQVTEIRVGNNECIGQDGQSDLYLDPWCRTVKRLRVDANIKTLDVFCVGMGPAGLLVLTQSGLLGQLTLLNLGSNAIIGDGNYKERQRIARVSEQRLHGECADVWASFCEALCHSTIVELNLSNTGLVPHSLSTLADSLHRNAKLIAKQETLRTMVLSDNDLTANGDVSGLAIFLVSASSVETLDISTARLGPGCAEALSHELSEMLNLTSLNIASNNIGVDGALLVAHKMQQHSQQLSLLLIGDAAKPTAIPVNQHISDKLDWGGRGLRPADAVLFSALLPTVKVAKLDLCGNELGCVGKATVAAAFRNWGAAGECPIEQLRIDLGRTASPGTWIKISQTSLDYPHRDLTAQDLHIIASFLERQRFVVSLDLSDNMNIFRLQDGDVEQWNSMCKALRRTTTGKKHDYHLCQPLFATNQEFLWTDHDAQSWRAYTKQLLGDEEEEIQTGCRRIAKPGTEYGKDLVQHAWWRLCQSIRISASSITDLHLSNVGLTPAYLLMLADGFAGGNYLQEEMRTIDLHKNLDLTGPQHAAEQTNQLDEFLSKFGTIAELNVSDCGLRNRGAQTISKHLHKISALNIVNNADIKVEGAKFIADSVITTDEKNFKVKLRLPGADDGSLTSETRLMLFGVRNSRQKGNRNLDDLGLADDPIRLQHVKVGLFVERIGASIGEVKTIPFYRKDLQMLSLARTALRDPDAVIIAAALSTLPNLEKLDIQGNKLGAAGKEALGRSIQDMGRLHTLIIDIGGHQPAEYHSSTSEDDDDYAELRANRKPDPSFTFGGRSNRTRRRDQIDLSHMDLRAEDLAIVTAWLRAPLSQVSALDMSHNEMMLSNQSTRAASVRYDPPAFVHQAWSNLCGAIKGTNIRRLALQNVGLTAEKEGQDQWCIDPLVRVLERTATLRSLDISDNFVLRYPGEGYFNPSDEEKLAWKQAAVAKRAIAEAMVRRSEGWLPYASLETGDAQFGNYNEGTQDISDSAASKIAEAVGRLQQEKDRHHQIEYKRASKPAYKPLEELRLDMGAPSSKQELTTSYAQQYTDGSGKTYDVEPSQELAVDNCFLRADDAILLAALVTVWDNSGAVKKVHLNVANNMLGLSGRKVIIDAFTRGQRSTFTESATLVINIGRWKKRNDKKESVTLPLAVPVANMGYIKWDKGFGQKQLALLSAWLREAVAHKKSNVYEINLSNNPYLGWWDLKGALIEIIIARDERRKAKGLKRLGLSELNAIVYNENQVDIEEIEARIVKHVPEFEQMPANLRHGLDRALIMLSQCKASAKKVEVLRLNGCGLNPARLKALAEAIRPERSPTAQGFLKLSELHLNDNRDLVHVAGAKLSKAQPDGWNRLCQAIAQSSQLHQLRSVSISGCRLNDDCVKVLSAHLISKVNSKQKSKSNQRLHTLDISKNDTLSSIGGKYLADALVVSDNNWPVVEIVLGYDDRAFLATQGITAPLNRGDAKSSRGGSQSDDEVDKDIERDPSNTLPLEKQAQIEQEALFRPLVEDEVRSVHRRVLSMECKGLTPGHAWILGVWLDTREKIFSTSERAGMTICCLKLRGNPLTGSTFRNLSGTQSLKNSPRSQRPVNPGSVASWTKTGGAIDNETLGFGKLCEAFGLPSITDVDLSYCGLGAKAMHEMTKSEHSVDNVPWLRHAQLLSLNLSHNPIGIEGRKHLRAALNDADIQHLTIDLGGKPQLLDAAVTKLDFSKSHELSAEDAIVLAGWLTAAKVKTNLVELVVSNNDLFNPDCNGFADLMEAVPISGITTLKMARIGLTSAGALHVADMIGKCVSLRDPKRQLVALSLSGNTFAANQGQKAFRTICDAISTSAIGTLDFSDMDLSSDLVDKQFRPIFRTENFKESQIKQIVITGNPACLSNDTMDKLVKQNSALSRKLFYKVEHKLALNDTSQVTSRYEQWREQQQLAKSPKKDTQLMTQFADLPSNPYNITKGKQQLGNRTTQKDSGKERPQLRRNKSSHPESQTRKVIPSLSKSSSVPKLQATNSKTGTRKSELQLSKSGRQGSSFSGANTPERQPTNSLEISNEPLGNSASDTSPKGILKYTGNGKSKPDRRALG